MFVGFQELVHEGLTVRRSGCICFPPEVYSSTVLLLDLLDQHKHFSTQATRSAVSEPMIFPAQPIKMQLKKTPWQLRNQGVLKAVLSLNSCHATATAIGKKCDDSLPVR